MRVGLDTNIIVYSEQLVAENDRAKGELSRNLIRRLFSAAGRPILPAQALFEFVEVARRKFGLCPIEASERARMMVVAYEFRPSNLTIVADALGLLERHRLQIFDAVVVATAANAGCDLLLSEDLQDGFRWNGVTISNPFAPRPNPRLAPFLA